MHRSTITTRNVSYTTSGISISLTSEVFEPDFDFTDATDLTDALLESFCILRVSTASPFSEAIEPDFDLTEVLLATNLTDVLLGSFCTLTFTAISSFSEDFEPDLDLTEVLLVTCLTEDVL